ncbi:MAG: ribonucleotide-diphosphate reductase subunit beta [Solirubrobacteraceae bacterium]
MGSLLSPQALFALWERQQWSAYAVDLRPDRRQWSELPLGLRERLLWHTGAFFVGEERVAVELGPLVAAGATATETAFLTSQQVDEARHALYFDRFYDEVVGVQGSIEDRLGVARQAVGEQFVELLDRRLGRAAARLRADPGDAEAKTDYVCVYHMVIEGMLALTGQRMLVAFLEQRRILPGWVTGLRMIARDEHRHIAYGAWALHELARDPQLGARAAEQLAQLAPLAAGVFVPPGARPERFRPLGLTGAAAQRAALDALGRRMAAIGIPVPAGISA